MSTDSEQLISLFSKKLSILQEILAYSQEQRGLSYQENSSKYDNLIESRAKCLEELEKLEVVLKRSQNGLSNNSFENDSVGERLTKLNSKIADTLKEIVALDVENKDRISKERADLKSKLHNVRQGRKGIVGYSGNKQLSASGIFTDSKK